MAPAAIRSRQNALLRRSRECFTLPPPPLFLSSLLDTFADRESSSAKRKAMSAAWKLVLALVLSFAVAHARPSGFTEPDSPLDPDSNSLLSTIESQPKLYFVIAEAVDAGARGVAANDEEAEARIEKRSAEAKDDLETAAGTNVLRPLFVYRQQLAYRERAKGAVRRLGIRPGF